MIDTHAHLYDEQFDADRDEMIVRARAAGVEGFIIPAIDSTSFDRMMTLCRSYSDCCFPCIGLHPTSVGANYESELSFVEENIDKYKFKAVGEIGIDSYWPTEYAEQQIFVFEQQIKWADARGLPVIIHARQSFDVIFKVLDRVRTDKTRGIFHSFTGTASDYAKIKSYGSFKIGVGGVLTFKKSSLPEVLKEVPLNEIVLETDSPYLAPHPFRGKRNESGWLPIIAEKLAEIKNVSIEYVDKITTANAVETFGLLDY
ncbi:MAG: TatD family hydrolase [Prevotellaceae bacterium]|nr:TatD family hydrolase [Prevotellaceae bacterium]